MINKEQRLKLLERLVKEGSISLSEAFDLLETEKEYVSTQPYTPNPWIQPYHTEPYGPGIGGTPFKLTFSDQMFPGTVKL